MLKKYAITYSADVSIDIQNRITKKIKTEVHEIRDKTEIFYLDDDIIKAGKPLEEYLISRIKDDIIFWILPATIFNQYLYNTIEVKVYYIDSKWAMPTIREIIDNGTIEDLREILLEKP